MLVLGSDQLLGQHITTCTEGVAVGTILLFGAIKNNEKVIRGCLIWGAFEIVVAIIGVIVIIVVICSMSRSDDIDFDRRRLLVELIIIILIAMIIKMYFWFCILSYRKQLKCEQNMHRLLV